MSKVIKSNKITASIVIKFAYDLFAFTISSFIAFYIRFDFSFDILLIRMYSRYIIKAAIIEFIIGFIVIVIYKTYRDIWHYTSIGEIFKIGKAVVLEKITFISIISLLSLIGFPKSIFIISTVIAFILLIIPRVVERLVREIKRNGYVSTSENNTIIVGAGDAGEKIIREIKAHPNLGYNVKGLIDDGTNKHGCYIQGVKVLGDTESIPQLVKDLDIKTILVAIPSAERKELKRIYDLTSKLPVKLLVLPGIYEIIGEDVTVSHLRPFGLEDLLFRERVILLTERSIKKFDGLKVLVTGACGSIGYQICKKLIDLKAEVIALDNNETGIFDLSNELKVKGKIIPVVGDIRSKDKLLSIFEKYRPEVVFHAAAYKHVPLMELFPEEAFTNNVIGTLNVIEACMESQIPQCVVISTDKAVNPKNIMGISKRINELMVLSANNNSNCKTKFSIVRFGNVLGSRGNVIEIWKREFEKGEPLSITDPNMKRYFMLTEEAASLVIESSTIASPGDLLILDMGKEISILKLAEEFCRLQGSSIKEIGYKVNGIRAGEKLTELLYSSEEQLENTEHVKIIRIKSNTKYDWNNINSKIASMKKSLNNEDFSITDTFKSFIDIENR